MRITILNFAKYNPRDDVKNPSWVRLERNWWVDMFSWGADVQRIWFMLLGVVDPKGEAEIDENFISAILQIDKNAVTNSINFLVEKERISVITKITTTSDVTRTLRVRNADVTSAGATGRDETRRDDIVLLRNTHPTTPPAEGLLGVWNSSCGPSLPKASKLTPKRKEKVLARLREEPELDYWRLTVEKLAASSFCTGNSEQGWRASFDWLIANDTNHVKTNEGKYDNKSDSTQEYDWSKVFSPEDKKIES
jgi:hypothetical protein